MKIVDLKTFLSYPDGVVFCEYEPCMAGPIEIRGSAYMEESLRSCAYQSFGLLDSEDMLYQVGDQSKIETDMYSRTGPGLDEKQLFIVFDKNDLSEIIERLQRARDEAKE